MNPRQVDLGRRRAGRLPAWLNWPPILALESSRQAAARHGGRPVMLAIGGKSVREFNRFAAIAAVASCLCACAAAPQRPAHLSAQQLTQVLPLTVSEVVPQKELLAQSTYEVPNVQTFPVGAAPIVPVALGGALGMFIVDSAEKASAERFAKAHVLPVQTALAGYDATADVRRSIGDALAADPSVFAAVTPADHVPASAAGGHHAVAVASYALTPDFSAVQVSLSLQIFDGGNKPTYANRYVFQSARKTLAPKTAEDVRQSIDEEDRRYAALDVNAQIARANALGRSTEGARLRTAILAEQNEHRLRMASARKSVWDADASAQRLAAMWAEDGGVAVKRALQESGPILEHLIDLDLKAPVQTGDIPVSGKQIAGNAERCVLMRRDGSLISLATKDSYVDATPKLGPEIRMPVSAAR